MAKLDGLLAFWIMFFFFKKKKLDWYDDVGVYNKLFGIGYGCELLGKKYRS